MRPKNLALVVLIVALLDISIWWIMQPAEVAPVKTVQAREPAKVVAPPTVVVEMPKLAPAVPSSSPPVAEDDTPQPAKPPVDWLNMGTIEFTAGVPVTKFLNDGTQCTLTAHAIHMVYPEGMVRANNLEQMEIDVALQSPDAGKIQNLRITVLNGKQTRVGTDKAGLDFTAHMNFN